MRVAYLLLFSMRLNICQQTITLARAALLSLSIEQACGHGTPQYHIIISTG